MHMIADPKGEVNSIHMPPDRQAELQLHRASLCLRLVFVQEGRTLIGNGDVTCYIQEPRT